MDRSDTTAANHANNFFADLPLLAQASAVFDTTQYRGAPDDWELVVTDIAGSTPAVAAGKHKTVNFVAAMAIAALKNLCAPTRLPFLFGGDGSARASESRAPGAGVTVDLDGLCCRWNPLQSGRGRMLTLIIQRATDPGAVHAQVMHLAQQSGAAAPVRPGTLRTGWPPKGMMLEAQATRRDGPLWLAVLRVLSNTLLAQLIFMFGRPVGGFDPKQYI